MVPNTGFPPMSTSPGLLQAYQPQHHPGLLASAHRQAPAHRCLSMGCSVCLEHSSLLSSLRKRPLIPQILAQCKPLGSFPGLGKVLSGSETTPRSPWWTWFYFCFYLTWLTFAYTRGCKQVVMSCLAHGIYKSQELVGKIGKYHKMSDFCNLFF